MMSNHALQVKIGIRGQAILVMAVVLSWYGSIVGVIDDDDSELFWSALMGALMLLLPLLITILMVILIVSYRRSDETNRGWFLAALVAAGSCWGLLAFVVFVVLMLMINH